MSRATPAQLALAAAGCLSALADTRRSKHADHPAYANVEYAARGEAKHAFAEWWLATREPTVGGVACAFIYENVGCSVSTGAPHADTLDAWAEALRAWAREHEDPREPSRESRVDEAVSWLIPIDHIPSKIKYRATGSGETIVCDAGEIRASLARLGAIERDGRWTLPQHPGSAAAPEATAAPSPPQKPASVAAEGGTVGERVARAWWGTVPLEAEGDFADLVTRIDDAVSQSRALASDLRTEIDRLTRERDNAGVYEDAAIHELLTEREERGAERERWQSSVAAAARGAAGALTQRDEQAALAQAWQKTAEEEIARRMTAILERDAAVARADKAEGDRDFAAGEWGRAGAERDAAVARADEATRKLAASDALLSQIEALAKKYGAYK